MPACKQRVCIDRDRHRMPNGYSYLNLHYPQLNRLPREFLGAFPTPVTRHQTGRLPLYVKHDDLTHPLYGGNKLRKLEYLFGQALARGHRSVATFGAAGSNHALATALHARSLGLACTCLLVHQPKTPSVRRTLAMHLAIGTRLVPWRGYGREDLSLYRRLFRGPDAAHRPFVIPMGGSSWQGAVGYVNAAFELARQVEAGELPEPSRIYVPLGTMGTVAGLALGLAAAGLRSRLIAVRVVIEAVADEARTRRLAEKTNTLLRRLDADFPVVEPGRLNLEFRHEFLGPGYAVPTPEAVSAVAWAKERLDLGLETTYSGKALSALLADAEGGVPDAGPALFWNTYSSAPLPAAADEPAGPTLPEAFRRYFED